MTIDYSPKFHIGQMVRYVGKEGRWSPIHGAIGKVLKIDEFGKNFLVEFDKPQVPVLNNFRDGAHFWYHEDELEPVEDNKNMARATCCCMDWIR